MMAANQQKISVECVFSIFLFLRVVCSCYGYLAVSRERSLIAEAPFIAAIEVTYVGCVFLWEFSFGGEEINFLPDIIFEQVILPAQQP